MVLEACVCTKLSCNRFHACQNLEKSTSEGAESSGPPCRVMAVPGMVTCAADTAFCRGSVTPAHTPTLKASSTAATTPAAIHLGLFIRPIIAHPPAAGRGYQIPAGGRG